ncbi:MAG: HAD family phosphatase [Clostridia bacterium]|nr:HAD family phosphatase [Clostridia bacterium]MBR6741223.1 HAD family phosphatase [Clostridia bacterium]
MITFLFDFDGTLVDSMPTYTSVMLRILNENNISYAKDIIKTITPLGINGAAEYYINTLGINKSKEELIDSMKSYMLEAYYNTIPAKKNVISVLTELKNRGDSLNVLTASPHITLDACLKRLGIYDLFDNVWSCDDFNTTKANPDIYVMAAKLLNKNIEDIWFLDDNLGADMTAKTAGMNVCGVYDDSSKDYAEEIKSIADDYIYDFSELLSLQIHEK